MLQVTRLHTQGRPCADRRKSEDDLISNPLFTNFVRPCCAELVGTAFVVIFSALHHFFTPLLMERGPCRFTELPYRAQGGRAAGRLIRAGVRTIALHDDLWAYQVRSSTASMLPHESH